MWRRQFIQTTAAVSALLYLPSCMSQRKKNIMYGLIGKMLATSGNRDTLVDILAENTTKMPGCISYIIAKDSSDANAIWITEVWESQELHQASLSLPAVQDAIKRARPIIAGFGERFETIPVAGFDVE
jgi:quinol monooxygenase YgiN